MAEHRPSVPFDDAELRERLSSFASAGAAASLHDPVPGVSTVRAHAQRRRAAVAVVSALAVAVVSVGVAGALGWGGEQAAPNPASPSPAVTTTPPTPSESPTPDPTVAPTTPTTTTTTTSEPPAHQVPTTIPDDMRLPSEGESVNGYQWRAGDATGSLCDGTSVPELAAYDSVTDSRHIELRGEEFGWGEELMVLENADAAVELMAQIRSAASECPAIYADPEEDSVTRVDDLAGSWGEGILIRSSFRSTDAGVPPDAYISGEVVAVIRTGSAVALASVSGEGFYDASDETYAPSASRVRATLDEIAPQLCVFTQAGC